MNQTVTICQNKTREAKIFYCLCMLKGKQKRTSDHCMNKAQSITVQLCEGSLPSAVLNTTGTSMQNKVKKLSYIT